MSSFLGFVVGVIQSTLALFGLAQPAPQAIVQLPSASTQVLEQQAREKIVAAQERQAQIPMQNPVVQTGPMPTAHNNQTTSSSASFSFSATPTSGTAPLEVSFLYGDSKAGQGYAIDFGDGATKKLTYDALACHAGGCYDGMYTYQSAGTYTARLLAVAAGAHGADVELSRVSITVGSTPSSSVSVPGMTKYTDTDFGFSFWYPSGWKITKRDVPSTGTDRAWDLKYIDVGEHITLIVRKPMDDGSFFVSPNVVLTPAARYGLTMGGLASYDEASPDSTYRTFAVLLNSRVSVFAGWSNASWGADLDPRALLKTITPIDSTSGTQSVAEQTATIQAEKNAYTSQ